MTQKPSVGRIVHFVDYYNWPGGERQPTCLAAIVTGVDEPTATDPLGYNERASLYVFGQFSADHKLSVCHDRTSSRNGGTWHWPERTEESK